MKKKCPLCNNQNIKFNFVVNNYELLQCNLCELYFIYPYPKNIDKEYDRVATAKNDKLNIIDPKTQFESGQEYYKRYFKLIDSECGAAKSILDIGAGGGNLLMLLGKNRKLHRVGIEINEKRAIMARKNAKCTIYDIPIEKISFNRKFDVITMINVFSHIPSLDILFKKIKRIMNKNGKLLIMTGELENNVKKRNVFEWGVPDHLHFLGKKTMRYISNKYGYNLETHISFSYADDLFSEGRFRHKGRSNVRNFMKNIFLRYPYSIKILNRAYKIINGDKIHFSFNVLTVKDKL